MLPKRDTCFENEFRKASTSHSDQYLLAVRALVKTCGFGSMADKMVKDQIVCGVQDEDQIYR